MVDRALDAGITLFDTADIYDFGVSEEYPRRGAGRPPRPGRVGHQGAATRWSDDPLDAAACRRAGSCSRARTACAGCGPTTSTSTRCTGPTPTRRSTRRWHAFDELVKAGKVRAIGTSTFSPAQLDEAAARADALGVTVPTSEQPPYSVLGSRHRGRRCCRACLRARRRRDRVGAAQRWLADRASTRSIGRRRRPALPASPITSTIVTQRCAETSATWSLRLAISPPTTASPSSSWRSASCSPTRRCRRR